MSLLLPSSTAFSAINKMSYAGCACICNGDEIAMSGDLVVVADAGKGLLFRYTPNGTFAGFIGSAIECKQAYPFRPIRIVSDGNQYHALNMAGKTVDIIGANGDRISSVSLLEAGLGSSIPVSLAYGDDTVFLGFSNGAVVACDYDLTVSARTEIPNVISIYHWSGRLYALTAKGEIRIFNDQLKEQASLDSFKHLPGFLNDPQDIFVDQSGNVWIADTGNKRIVVVWSDGTFSTWGETSKSYELNDMVGNPISGRQQVKLTPRRVAAQTDYFFISTPDHQSYSIPIGNLTRKQEFGIKHLISFRMSPDKYRKHQQYLWNLQQEMYPQTAIKVTIDSQIESIYVNGERMDASIDEVCRNNDSLWCLLDGVAGKTDNAFFNYREKDYLVFERENVTRDIQVAVIERLSGGNNPLQSEPVGRIAIMPEDLKVSIKLPKIQNDAVYVVSVFDNNGRFLDMFFVH